MPAAALEAEDTIRLTRHITVLSGRGGTKRTTTFEKGALFSGRSEIAAKLGEVDPTAFETVDGQVMKRGRR